MSDTFTISIEEEPQVFTVAIQEAQDGAPGVTPQLRATGTALEASEDEGETWTELIDLADHAVTLTGNQSVAGTKTFTGNIGVGITPGTKFDIQGQTGSGSNGVVTVRGYDAFGQAMVLAQAAGYTGNSVLTFKSNSGMGMGVNFASGVPQYYDFTNSAGGSLFRIRENGNIGVGVNPTEQFHLHSTGAYAVVKMTTTNTGSAGGDGSVFAVENATGNFQIVNKEAAAVQFYTNNTERMKVDSAGNVGIGISPTSRFHVSGTTTLAGQTELTSQLATNGTSAMTRDLGDARFTRRATVPASAGAAGTEGMFAWDSGFLYVCTAPNTWKRVAIASW